LELDDCEELSDVFPAARAALLESARSAMARGRSFMWGSFLGEVDSERKWPLSAIGQRRVLGCPGKDRCGGGPMRLRLALAIFETVVSLSRTWYACSIHGDERSFAS
jgi:hypothetical protein